MTNFLIVGQGIAGSVLALHLLDRGQRVLVVNNGQAPSASNAAAGLYNPITGRFLTKTWMADALFPYLDQFYRKAEHVLRAKFLHPLSIFRPFVSETERTKWQTRAAEVSNFVMDIVPSPPHSVHQHAGLLLRQSGYLNVRRFVEATRTHLIKLGAYLDTRFVYDQLHTTEQAVHYQGITTQQIIFCEGAGVLQNPFFKTLPFRPVKGEMLRVGLLQPLQRIYNRGIFIIPETDTQALVGATYNHQDLTWGPSESAREDLEHRLKSNFRLNYTVRDHWAGIRPATFDRRPFMGSHPQHARMKIFNGLGTKGVSLAPYLAKIFVDHLLSYQPLPEAVRLERVQGWRTEVCAPMTHSLTILSTK